MTEQKTFMRWYDSNKDLRHLVETLEKMDDQNRQLFSQLICTFWETLIESESPPAFIKNLSWSKMLNVARSKAKRRWYDQDPLVHKAFNLLQALNDENRALIAQNLYPSAKTVYDYELFCREKQRQQDQDIIDQIIETAFSEGLEAAANVYAKASS